MKDKPLFLLAVTMIGILFPGSTFAKPLLTQTKTSGSVAPPYHYSTECMIYRHKIVIKKQAGEIESKIMSRISLYGPVFDLIDAASAGEIIEEGGSIGGPQESDIAYNKRGEATLLLQTGFVNRTNNAPEAATLINFLNLHCK